LAEFPTGKEHGSDTKCLEETVSWSRQQKKEGCYNNH